VLFVANLDHGGPDGMVWYGCVGCHGSRISVVKASDPGCQCHSMMMMTVMMNDDDDDVTWQSIVTGVLNVVLV